MFNLNIAEEVNNSYKPKQVRQDVAASMQKRLNNNLQKQEMQKTQQQGTPAAMPTVNQDWGRTN